MDLLLAVPELDDPVAPPASTRRLLYPWDVLLPVSVALWAIGVSQAPTTPLGQYGLPTSLPFLFYAGIGLLLVSIGWALAMAHPSSIRLGAHLGILILMLYGTAPLVYEESRYSWLFKYIGVVQYVNTQGHVNQHIDIFQNWPGFFAFVAWFDNAAGIHDPVVYAKWAQLAFELLTCIMLAFVFRTLPLTVRERWLALFFYAGSIWIAQDYLSPQALGVVLSAGIFGLALTYLPRSEEARWLAWLRHRLEPIGRILRPPLNASAQASAYADEENLPPSIRESGGQDVAIVTAILITYFVLVFEHELSPYVVMIQLACLALIGRLRYRWMVLVFAAIAFGYFAPRFAYVNGKFGIIASIGNFFGNATTPLVSLGKVKVSAGVTASSDAARLLTVGMWGLGALGAVRRWRNRRPTLALVLLAYSPAVVFFAGAYGDEGLLRVYLFSLPWTACLAASAIKPIAANSTRWKIGVLRAPIALAVAIALFFPAFFGDDYAYVMPKGEVQGSLAFYQAAAPGTLFVGDGDFPDQINQRYNDFPEVPLFDVGGILNKPNPPITDAAKLTRIIEANNPNPKAPSYLILTNSMQKFGTAFGFLQPGEIDKLKATFDNAPGWSRIYNKQGYTVYELPPFG